MAKNIHKGSEFSNIKETWTQNEKERANRDTHPPAEESLDQIIEQESSEYDHSNKEERLLSGDRASLNDENALQE